MTRRIREKGKNPNIILDDWIIRDDMETAKLFNNGGSQAVRLPKDCRFDSETVMAHRVGNVVMLVPENDAMAETINGLYMFSEDFENDDKEEPAFDKREEL